VEKAAGTIRPYAEATKTTKVLTTKITKGTKNGKITNIRVRCMILVFPSTIAWSPVSLASLCVQAVADIRRPHSVRKYNANAMPDTI
jgi:hypothetical protein